MSTRPGMHARSPRTPRPRSRRRVALAAALVLLAVGGLVAAFGGPRRVAWMVGQALVTPTAPPPAATTRDDRWRQDLEYLRVNLPRLHGHAFHTVPHARFEAEVAAAVARIEASTDAQLLLEVMRLVALVGDGHTSTWAHLDAFPEVPLQFLPVGPTLVVSVASPLHADLLGAELVRIGDVGAAEAIERLSAYAAAESSEDLQSRIARMLERPALLHAAGLTAEPDRFSVTVRTTDGAVLRQDVAVDPTAPLTAPADALAFRAEPERDAWVMTLEEHEAVYVRFRRCRDHDGFAAVAADALARLDARPLARVLVDLRGNGGGDSTVIRPLLDGLRARGAGPRTIAIVDGGTYSSATMNARELRALGARVVGEPTGDTGGGWGEVRQFALPNSGIPIAVATYFHGHGAGRVVPDVLVRPDVGLWLMGVDPVLEAALSR